MSVSCEDRASGVVEAGVFSVVVPRCLSRESVAVSCCLPRECELVALSGVSGLGSDTTDRCRCLCGEALGFDSLVGGDLSDRERSRADENYTFVTDRSVVERQWRSSKVVGVSV